MEKRGKDKQAGYDRVGKEILTVSLYKPILTVCSKNLLNKSNLGEEKGGTDKNDKGGKYEMKEKSQMHDRERQIMD